MNSMADANVTDELCDDREVCHSFHSSMDEDEDNMTRILIVCQVPDAVFEEQQAQVICPCLLSLQSNCQMFGPACEIIQ